MAASPDDFLEPIVVPRGFLHFPLTVRPPVTFRAEAPSTWPSVPGRLEYVGQELRYMPPCGVNQQKTVADLARVLGNWRVTTGHAFVVGTNEAGMKLGDDVRAADAAVWPVADQPADRGGLFRVAPALACEVAGRDEGEAALVEKAAWYLDHGTPTVWLLFPATREVWVVTAAGTQRCAVTARVPEPAGLSGLAPPVAELFDQLRD